MLYSGKDFLRSSLIWLLSHRTRIGLSFLKRNWSSSFLQNKPQTPFLLISYISLCYEMINGYFFRKYYDGGIIITSYIKLHSIIQPHSKPYNIFNFEQLFSTINMKVENCFYEVGAVDPILYILFFFLIVNFRISCWTLKGLESIFSAMMSTIHVKKPLC